MIKDHKNFQAQSDVNEMSKAIIDVVKSAKKHNLHCWLDYGVLLGMIRENRLLPWNNDAEIYCKFDKYINKKFIKMLDELSLMEYNVYYYPTIGTLNITKKGVVININSIWEENGMAVRPHDECTKLKRDGVIYYRRILPYFCYWLARSMSVYTRNISFKKIIKANSKEKMKIALIYVNKLFPRKVRQLFFSFLIKLSKFFGAKFIKTAIPIKFYDEFINIDFYSYKMSIPKRNIELLEYIYGSEWKVPMANWVFYDKRNKNVTNMQYINESFDYKKANFI